MKGKTFNRKEMAKEINVRQKNIPCRAIKPFSEFQLTEEPGSYNQEPNRILKF